MRMRIGFKTAAVSKTDGVVDRFYKPLIAAGIAPVVMSIDSAGHCYDVQKLVVGTPLERKAVMNYRRTGDATAGQPDGMDVPDYNADPVRDAERMWQWHISRWPRELRPDLVWTQFTNEPRKEATEWLARHALRLCALALETGRRITLFGWSAGTPEPEAWRGPFMKQVLALCRQYPEQLAIALNEYSLVGDRLERPAHIGRWRDAPELRGVPLFITEFGWTYNDAPAAATGVSQIVEAYRKWYAADNVKGLALWTLDKGRGGGRLPDIIHGYMEPLARAIIDVDIPPLGDEPAAPPVEPPTVPADPLLVMRESWEGGHYHLNDANGYPIMALQVPTGWDIKWRETKGNEWANPFSEWGFVRPEMNRLPESKLPANERKGGPNALIRDGDHTLKLFKGAGAWYATLIRRIEASAGTYRATLPVFPDLVKAYANGAKVWADDAQWRDGLIRIRINERIVTTGWPEFADVYGGGWIPLVPGRWNDFVVMFEAAGAFDFKVDFLCPFPLPQNGVFVDDWQIERTVTEPKPPPVIPPPPPPVTPPPPPPPPVTPLKIIDISKWQGTVDPAKMKTAGVDGVMVRAGYGTVTDERVHEYVPKLRAAGLPVGFYHYFHPWEPAEAQFATFRAVVERHGYQMRLALDLEEPKGVISDTKNAARRFMLLMEQAFPLPAGKRHLIYTNSNYWRTSMGAPGWGGEYDLWIAAWTTASRPAVPLPWQDWRLWQHSNSGDGPAHGVQSARLDLNRFNPGNRDAWRQWLVNETGTPGTDIALWEAGQRTRVIVSAPASALEKAMWDAGYAPAGNEARTTVAGVEYAVRPAVNRDGKERLYFAVVPQWNAVRWMEALGSVPVAPPQPPPVESAIDLLPYLRGDGRIYEVRHSSGATETFQTQVSGDTFWQVKNAQWEELRYDKDFIWRGLDTSPGPDSKGVARYYRQFEAMMKHARWCPRRMRLGETWVAPVQHYVQFYRKDNCQPLAENSGVAVNRITFVARHASKTWNGITVNDVIELKTAHETYFYARDFGLVAWGSGWGSSAVAQVYTPGARSDNKRETIGCLT